MPDDHIGLGIKFAHLVEYPRLSSDRMTASRARRVWKSCRARAGPGRAVANPAPRQVANHRSPRGDPKALWRSGRGLSRVGAGHAGRQRRWATGAMAMAPGDPDHLLLFTLLVLRAEVVDRDDLAAALLA